eukprot:2014139-Amphidinium_carterae.1
MGTPESNIFIASRLERECQNVYGVCLHRIHSRGSNVSKAAQQSAIGTTVSCVVRMCMEKCDSSACWGTVE